MEETGGRLRRRRSFGKRLKPLLPGRDLAPECRIGRETRLGRPALFAGQRAEHVLARQGFLLVVVQSRPPRHSFKVIRLRLRIVFTVATGRSNRSPSSSLLQP